MPARAPSRQIVSPERLKQLIACAVKAPSAHNSQPWLFHLADDAVLLFADRTRALPVNDPEDRELTISCGAALFHLRVAAWHEGLEPSVELFPEDRDDDLLARVTFSPRAESDSDERRAEEEALFGAIDVRRTYRKRFEDRPVAESLTADLVAAVDRERAWLYVARETTARAIATLVAEGDRLQYADPRWRRELAAWMHPRRRGDGLAVPELAASVARLVVSALNLGRISGGQDRKLADGLPLLVVLGTPGDQRDEWIAAGQALARMLLLAASQGMQAAYLNQPCQVAELRPRLQRLLPRAGFPQLIIRMGYPAEPVERAPRRSLDAVIDRSLEF